MPKTNTTNQLITQAVESGINSGLQSVGNGIVKGVMQAQSNDIDRVTIKSLRTAILNKRNKKILRIYLEALNSAGCENQYLKPGASRTRRGISGRLRSAIGRITDINMSGDECDINILQVQLDNPAEMLLEEYKNYLNEILLDKMAISAEELVGDKIKNPAILLYVLLIQCFTLALDKNIDHKGLDGQAIAKAMRIFSEKLRGERSLKVRRGLKSKISEIQKELQTGHNYWLDFLEKMVEAIRLLHLNSNAINNVKKYLKEAKSVIKAHLIAELNSKMNEYGFHADIIDHTLQTAEDKKLSKKQLAEYKSSNKNSNERQRFRHRCVIDSIGESKLSEFSNVHKKKVIIEELYSLLEKTIELERAVGTVDLLNTIGSWGFILSGLFKIENMAKLIRNHGRRCRSALSYNADSPIFNKNAIQGLLKFTPPEGGLTKFSTLAANQLMELKNPIVVEKIIRYFHDNFMTLVQIDMSRQFDIELIDRKRLKEMQECGINTGNIYTLLLEPLSSTANIMQSFRQGDTSDLIAQARAQGQRRNHSDSSNESDPDNVPYTSSYDSNYSSYSNSNSTNSAYSSYSYGSSSAEEDSSSLSP
jgi:hypothetical protein